MKRKLIGLRRKRGKWQAHVKIHGKQHTATFELSTPIDEMRAWRDEEIAAHTGTLLASDSLAADVQAYVHRRRTMPTIKQRAAHLDLWVHALGGRRRSRHSVRDVEIEQVLEDWLEHGLAPGTVKKRRTALQSFYKALNGKRGKNPVKGTPIPQEPKPEARHLERAIIERAIQAMPPYRSTKPGAPRVLSLSPLRAAVIATTGIPPGLLQQVQPHDLVLVGPGSVRVTARRKGGGVEARTVPLVPDGLAAWKAFHAANAYGPFATEALNRAFKRGCKRVGLDPKAVHLYDLRHSFLTDLYRVTRDLATVGRLGLHTEGSKMTARYAKGANQEVDAAAVAALGAAWQQRRQASLKVATPGQNAGTKVPAKGARVNKLRRVR